MVITKNLIMLSLLTTLIVGCGGNDVRPGLITEQGQGPVENDTVYTHGLKCIGKEITKAGQAGKLTVAVDNIKDKTTKNFTASALTQGTSDMAVTAFANVGAVHVLAAIPGDGFGHIQMKENEPGKTIGDILPSHVFLAGAITEYNKDLRTRQWGFNFLRNLLKLGVSGSDNVINVAMDLRLVASRKGKILKNSKGKLLNLSLQNNIVTKSYKGDLFRSWTTGRNDGGGGEIGFRINDPQHLAVREIVDRGVLILLGQLFEVNWKKCDVKKIPASAKKRSFQTQKSKPKLSKDPALMPGVTAQPARKPADWSQSLIGKLEGKLATGTQRSLYFNIPKIKSKTANYFESQLLSALVGSRLFKPLDSVTDLPKSELDQMGIEELRTRVESRPGFSIMAAFLEADSELSWQVSTEKSQVTVTVYLVDNSTVLTESVTFPSTVLPNEVAQSLLESPDGLSSQTGILKKNDDLKLDFVTTDGKAFVTYQKGEKVRFLMRTNRAAYPYVFILDYWGDSQKGITRLYPRSPGITPKRLDANKVWVFSKNLPIESSDRYMLWVIASEKQIDFPKNVSIEWLQAADRQELVSQGVGVGEYTDMGVVIHTKK